MMFDVMDRFLNTWIISVFTAEISSLRYFNHRIEVQHTGKNQTVPYGTAPWGGKSQALRARLRSHCPSGVCRTLVILKKATL